MKNINTKIVLLAVLIDVVGTTLVQVILQNLTTSQITLIAAGGMVSICAGYFLVMKNNFKVDLHLYILAGLTFLIGLIFLYFNNVLYLENFYWLLLTPALNLVGGLIAKNLKKS